jgi:uncharacterized protein YheU (UPF0270 family)
MVIPPERLSREALYGLVEEFISREGTDYGEYEIAMADKVSQLHRQLFTGEIVIAFDIATESINLMTKHQYDQSM